MQSTRTYTSRYPPCQPASAFSVSIALFQHPGSEPYKRPATTHLELIDDGVARRHRALVGKTRAVHVVGIYLVDAVEVEARRLIAKHVVHPDPDRVPLGGADFGTWPFVVYADDGAEEPVRGGIDPGDIPVVLDQLRRDHGC